MGKEEKSTHVVSPVMPTTEMRCQLVREIATDLEALKCKKCGEPFRGIFAEDLEPTPVVPVEPQLLMAHPVSISATSAEARKISARIAVLIANAKAREHGEKQK
jgi:hypothetical protein